MLHVHHIFANSLIFSSPEGHPLQFSIPRAYFVYTVWHVLDNTAVLSMHTRIVCLLAHGAPGERYYNTLLFCKEYLSSSSVVSRAFSAIRMYSQGLGIILIPQATFVQNFISFAAYIAELAHEEKSHTHQSLTQSIIQLI